MPLLTQRQFYTLRAYSDTGMRAASAASKIGISRSAMRRRLNKIEKETGIDPRNFWGLASLLLSQSWVQDGIQQQDIRPRAMYHLWQTGCSDRMIASVFKISRQLVQRWRDELELPPASEMYATDRWKFQIERNPVGGAWVVVRCNHGKTW